MSFNFGVFVFSYMDLINNKYMYNWTDVKYVDYGPVQNFTRCFNVNRTVYFGFDFDLEA